MTTAVCFHCGDLKFGSFCPCRACKNRPKTDDELIISLAMSDHYFEVETLNQMGDAIRQTGKPPTLHPDSYESFRQLIVDAKASGTMDEIFENWNEEE